MVEQRREARYAARIVARLGRRNQITELLTNDVSFRGVFVRTDSPPALRQLVKIQLVLPDDVVVSGHAMVVHVAERREGAAKGEGRIPGVGLQFWGAMDRAREWERFVRELKERERMGTPAARTTDKIRRASERFKMAVELELDGERVMTRDVSENGMAIRTHMPLPVGLRAEITFRSGDHRLAFDAIVRRQIDEPDFRGLGIELLDMSPEQRQDLVRFIRANAPSEEPLFVSPGDPKLH